MSAVPEPTPVVPPKSGWRSTEFYTTLAAKVFALLVALGVVNSSDADAYTKGISGVVAGIFVIATTYLAAHYTTRRTQVKTGVELFLVLLFCGLVAGPVCAGAPPGGPVAYTDVHYFGFFRQYHKIDPPQQTDPALIAAIQAQTNLLAQLLAKSGQNPPVIVMPGAPQGIAPPQQTLPIQGAPQQTLPIQGSPQQQIPIQGAPQQQLPIPGVPQQQIHIYGAPQQQLLPQGTPQQTLPQQGPQNAPQQQLSPPPGPKTDAGPSQGLQRFAQSRVLATWKPTR